jgi:hypothetical protein
MKQHVLGPYPFDPNLVSQGVPPDDRTNFQERIFAPPEGTPLPPGAVPAGTPPGAPTPGATDRPPAAPPAAIPDAPPAAVPDSPPAAVPNAFSGNTTGDVSAATANYDPRTGRYVGSDGQVYEQTDLTQSGAQSTFEDLLPH